MIHHSSLPVSFAQGTNILSTEAGVPVWPVSRQEDLEALANLANVFSCKLTTPRASTGKTSLLEDTVVVALTAEVAEDAKLYAHLTGRTFRVLKDIHSLQGLSNVAVLVLPSTSMCPRLIELALSCNHGRSVPGIIFG